MTRREAALILGVRESAVMEKIKEAHRRVMVANHPDAGGSHYLASKINEAKEVMSGKTKKFFHLGRTYFLTCPEDVIIFLIINNLTKTSEENRGVMYEK
ncbi:mitochondrial import inner membrane translocase subunit TIM14-3-like [Populus alba x Populus x berolinensis]|nr:mitochondrial import inner membrane translocase subunit TIM14-3-like [Populus alba x Populus x berolinensis]